MDAQEIAKNVYEIQVQVTSSGSENSFRYVQIHKEKVQTGIWKYEVF